MISLPLMGYVLKASLRDRLIVSLIVLIAVGTSLAVFVGSSAVVEKARFAAVFAASGLRFSGVAGLALFTVFYIRRAFDTKDVEFLLARPVSRGAFLLSHAAAFSLLAALLAAAVTLAVATLMPPGGGHALALWGASLATEFIIVSNAALFFSMILGSAVSGVLATAGLYVLARLMGELLGALVMAAQMPLFPVLSAAMKTVSVIVPRLDLMGQTSWLLYGAEGGIGFSFITAQGIIYSALLVTAALVDLTRRQF